MGAIDRFIRRGRRQEDYKPMMKRLEVAMLAACRAAGASAWYVADDFLTLGPNIFENGDFSQGATGWNPVAATFSIANGEATLTATSTASPQIYKSFPAVPGRNYLLSFEAKNISATDVRLHAGGTLASSSSASWTPMRGVINAGSVLPNLVCLLSASAVGQQGAFRNVEVREILSAKDFQDSAGTLPTYLSGTAGLLFDVSGVTGPELIAKPHTSAAWLAEGTTPPTAVNGSDSYLGKTCRSVTFPVVAAGGYSVCRARDTDIDGMFTVAAGTTYAASFEYALSRDLTTGESISIAVTGSSGIYSKNLSSGAPGGVWAPGSGSQPALASGGGTSLRPYATVLNAPLTVYIRALSVKVAGGNVVTQATAGNRPTVTRIPRKLGAELAVNGDFSSGAYGWGTNGSTVNTSAGDCAVTVSATTGRIEQNVSGKIQAGKAYAFTANAKSGSDISSRLNVIRSAAGGYATIAVAPVVPSGTNGINSVVFTAPADDAIVQVVNASGLTAGTFICDNISVREVLEWANVLTFDGSNDSLAAPASIIGATLTQPYTMISAFRVGQISLGQRTQGDTGRWVGLGSSNKLVVTHAGGATLGGSSDVALGDVVIQEVVWDGATVKIWRNGVLEASAALAAPTGVTPGAHNIGQNGGGTYFKGEKVLDVVCPAVMTDAQRLAVRKFGGAMMGLTL